MIHIKLSSYSLRTQSLSVRKCQIFYVLMFFIIVMFNKRNHFIGKSNETRIECKTRFCLHFIIAYIFRNFKLQIRILFSLFSASPFILKLFSGNRKSLVYRFLFLYLSLPLCWLWTFHWDLIYYLFISCSDFFFFYYKLVYFSMILKKDTYSSNFLISTYQGVALWEIYFLSSQQSSIDTIFAW